VKARQHKRVLVQEDDAGSCHEPEDDRGDSDDDADRELCLCPDQHRKQGWCDGCLACKRHCVCDPGEDDGNGLPTETDSVLEDDGPDMPAAFAHLPSEMVSANPLWRHAKLLRLPRRVLITAHSRKRICSTRSA